MEKRAKNCWADRWREEKAQDFNFLILSLLLTYNMSFRYTTK